MGHSISSDYAAIQMPTLDNGIRVLIDPIPYVHSFCMTVLLGAGSVNETSEESGVSHFLEHLFFKGTLTRSARKLMEEIEGRGGHLNAFTARDYMCLYVRALQEHVNVAVDILADILKNSQFFDFEKERNVVLEEIASAEDVPEDYVHDLFMTQLWPDHPLGRPVMGGEESVSSLTLESVRNYYQRWCTPENIIIAVAGNVSSDEVYDKIQDHFSDIKPKQIQANTSPPNHQQGITVVEREIGQSHLCMGFPGPNATDDSRYLAEMMTSVLGGGSTSRLFDRIREQEGLAYSIYSFRSGYRMAGCLGVYAAVAPQNLQKTHTLIWEEIGKLQDAPVPEDEMAINREQIRGGILLALESTSNRASHMARSVFYHGRIIDPSEMVTAIESVTADQIQQFAQKTLTSEKCAGVVLGPPPDTDEKGVPDE